MTLKDMAGRSAPSLLRRAMQRTVLTLEGAPQPPRTKRQVVDATWPNEGVKVWYYDQLMTLLDTAQVEIMNLLAATPFPRIGFAQDASPTQILSRALRTWGRLTVSRFDAMSKKIANDFATRNQQATQIAMQVAFKRAGWTVAFKPTARSVAAYQAVAAENIGLIKSIGQKYHADVQQQIWASVRKGGDLHTASLGLQKAYGVSSRRAALIARDQNNKAKAIMEATRQQELGITQAIWQHSHAGKEPRPVHVAWGKQEQVYELSKGLFDPDEGETVWPGSLIACRCSCRPIIEGFEE